MSTQHALFITAVMSILITANFAIINIALADIGGSALPNAASTCPADAVCLENPLGNSDAARSPQILIGNISHQIRTRRGRFSGSCHVYLQWHYLDVIGR